MILAYVFFKPENMEYKSFTVFLWLPNICESCKILIFFCFPYELQKILVSYLYVPDLFETTNDHSVKIWIYVKQPTQTLKNDKVKNTFVKWVDYRINLASYSVFNPILGELGVGLMCLLPRLKSGKFLTKIDSLWGLEVKWMFCELAK